MPAGNTATLEALERVLEHGRTAIRCIGLAFMLILALLLSGCATAPANTDAQQRMQTAAEACRARYPQVSYRAVDQWGIIRDIRGDSVSVNAFVECVKEQVGTPLRSW